MRIHVRVPASFALPVAFAAVLHGALWALFLHFSDSSSPLLLRYHVGSGAAFFGSRGTLTALPVSAAAACTLNILLFVLFRKRDKVFAYLFAWGAVVIQALFLFALMVLFLANRA